MAEFKYLDEVGLQTVVNKIKALIKENAELIAQNALLDKAEAEARQEADKVLSDKIDTLNLKSVVEAALVKGASSGVRYMIFKNLAGQVVSQVDVTDFVKDGMIDNVTLTDGKLVITFNTDAGKENIELELGDLFNAENYYTKEEADETFQEKGDYVEWSEYNGHKVIYLEEDQQIGGLPKESSGINMLQLRKYGSVPYPTVELGSTSATLTLNSVQGKVAIDGGEKQEIVATVSDVEAAVENVVRYTPFNLGNEQRKTIALDKRDTISSGGINIAMVSDYEGLDFSVVEIGGQKGALVLNTNDQPVKVEVTEEGKRQQYEVITSKNGVVYTPFTYKSENRKTIALNEGDTISSMGVNFGTVKTYDGLYYESGNAESGLMPVLEVGGQKGALVLNTCEARVKVEVVEGGKRVQHSIATLDDLDNLEVGTPITNEEIEAMFNED